MPLPPAAQTSFKLDTRKLRAFVVVDTLVQGRAMGGIRIAPQVTMEEVAALARKMTLKLALAELPIGGAKGGIVSALPNGPERDDRLRAFGELAGPQLRGGVYLGADLGCTYRDRDLIFESAKYTVRTTERRGPRAGQDIGYSWPELWKQCADVTGFGVCEAARTVREKMDWKGTRVVMVGFGVVGRGGARTFVRHGYKIVAVADLLGTLYCASGLPIEELAAITDSAGIVDRARLPKGVEQISVEEGWLSVETDLLVLAAHGDALRADNVGRVKAKIVVEAANLPVTEEAQQALGARQIVVVPDILANCGGAAVTGLVLSGAIPPSQPQGLVPWLFGEVSRRICRNMNSLLDAGEPYQLPRLARKLAMERAARLLGVDILSV